MCGRFRLSRSEKYLAEHFDAEVEAAFDAESSARYNIAPTQSVATIVWKPESERRWLLPMQWGLVPFWAKDPSIGSKLINARAETLAEKPAYRAALKQRRCLIPADGFYEWQKSGKTKQPFHIGMADDSTFAFAGLWESWKTPEGRALVTCTVITTTANELLRPLHERMPVILDQRNHDAWLRAPANETKSLLELLVPFEAERMRIYPVGTLVNSPNNDLEECMREVTLLPAITEKPKKKPAATNLELF